MKLHLPKQLFTALLAAITLATPAAWSLTASYEASFSTAADFTDELNHVTYKSGAITGSGILANNGTLSGGLKFDLKLNNGTNVTAPTKVVANIVSITTGSATWGFLMKTDGTVTGNWNGDSYPANTTEAQYLVTQDELAALKANAAATSVTLWAKINQGTGTRLYSAASMNGDSTLYSRADLHTTTGTVSSINVNSAYVDRVYYAAVAGTEGATATFTNTAGNWTKSWTVGNFIDAAGLAYQVDGSTELNSEYDIVAGGANGLSIAATEENAVTLGNTMYLATVTSANGSSVSISNGGKVNLNGAIYLVEDATLASTGDATITISGTVTDKGVPTGSAGSSVDGAYTLGLSGSGYHFTGAVDVNGLRLEEGAEATFDNLTIDSTITGTGKLILNNGTLNITNGDMLDDVAYTYANGAASGFRTGYSATLSEGSIETQDGAQINIALEGASGNVAGTLTGNTVSASYTSTVYDVNEALDYGAETMGGASRIQVNEAGTLTFAAGVTTTTPITNMGTVAINHGEGAVTLNTILSNITNAGTVNISGTGAVSAGAATTLAGRVVIDGGSFANSGQGLSGGTGGTLVLQNIANATLSGEQSVNVNVEVGSGATLSLANTDTFNWNSGNKLTVLTGGKVNVGSFRQSLSSSFEVIMAGGTIEGQGGTHSNYLYGLDFYNGGTIRATENSTINTAVGGTQGNGSITVNVDSNKTLTFEGQYAKFSGSKAISKTGAGNILYKGASFTNALTISGGVFEYYMEDTRAHSGSISGAGTFKKSGSGTLTLDSANTSRETTLNVAGGKLVYNSSTDTTATISGASGSTFEKTGSGTLTANTSSLASELLISEGMLKLSSEMGSDRRATVADGATLDVNGHAAYYNLTLQEGATLTNTHTVAAPVSTSTEKKQLHTITLEGDAKVTGTSQFGMVGNGWGQATLNLNGNTLTKEGSNTFHLYNTRVQSAGLIQVNGGKVITHSEKGSGTLDLTRASIGIDGGEFELGGNSQSIQDLTLTSGTLTIGDGLTLTTMGDVIMAGSKTEDTSTGTVTYTSTVSGNLCLSGTITLNGSVDMSGATLSGTSLGGFTLLDSAKPATSGLQSLTYQIWSGDGSVNSSQSDISVGGEKYTMNAATGTFTTADTVYYVATGDTITAGGAAPSAGTASATSFVVDGTLNIAGNASDSLTSVGILTGTLGSGAMVLQTNATLGNNTSTQFKGDIQIDSGSKLALGSAEVGSDTYAATVDVSSLRSVKLDGGELYIRGVQATLNEVESVAESTGSTLTVYDMTDAAHAVSIGALTLNADLTLYATWKSTINIDNVTGSGALTVNRSYTSGGAGDTTTINIHSLDGFTGSMSVGTSGQTTNLSISTGAVEGGVSFGGITTTAVNNFEFNVQTNTTVGTLDLSGSTTDTISVDAGKTLTVSTALSGLAPGSVTLGEGAVLDLTSQVVGSGTNPATAPFVTLLNLVSGSGTVKFQGFTLPTNNDSNESKWRVSLRGDTSLTLNSNVEVVKGIAFNTYNTGAGYKDILSSKNLTVGEELRLESAAKLVVSGGTVSAGSISLGHHGGGNYGHVQLTGGSIITGSIANTKSTDTGNTVTMSDGVLEITSASGIASGIQTTITGGTLKASGDVSWGITGASIGGAIIETGTGSINLAGGTLTNKLDNSAGNLALSGEFNVVSSGYTDKVATLNATSNGYASTSTVYTLVSDAAKLSGADTVTWKVDGATAAGNDTLGYADGALTHVSEGTEYYVVDSDIIYGNISKTNTKGEALTALVLNGKGVNLNASLGEGVKIKVQKVGESVVAIGSGVTLNANQVESTASQKLVLHGSGVYCHTLQALNDSNGAYNNPIRLDDSSWTGTVQLSGGNEKVKLTSDSLKTYKTSNSKLELKGLHAYAQDGIISPDLILTNKTADAIGDISKENLALRLDNGTSTADQKATFSGAISGSGSMAYIWGTVGEGGNATKKSTYVFSGNTSSWDGWFVNHEDSGKYVEVQFTKGGQVFDEAGNGGVIDRRAEGSSRMDVVINASNGSKTSFYGSIENARELTVATATDFHSTLKAGTVKIGETATLTAKDSGTVTISKAAMSTAGISTTATDGTKGTISNANVKIAQLAADASFTIQDMTLSNVKLSAEEGASVALNNVSGTAELAGAGNYTLGMVGAMENDNGDTALTLKYTSDLAITMSGTGSQLLLSADPTVDANGIFGTYNLTLTLNYTLDGIEVPTTTADWQELVGFTGILGDLLTAQTPEATVDLAEGEAAVAAAGSTPTVEYNYTAPGTGAQVGTLVITISGLNVPEPTTSTLSLLALAALAARRRRK